MIIAILILIANIHAGIFFSPASFDVASVITQEDMSWDEFHSESYREFSNEFTALFDSYRVKLTETRVMVFRASENKFARSIKRNKGYLSNETVSLKTVTF